MLNAHCDKRWKKRKVSGKILIAIGNCELMKSLRLIQNTKLCQCCEEFELVETIQNIFYRFSVLNQFLAQHTGPETRSQNSHHQRSRDHRSCSSPSPIPRMPVISAILGSLETSCFVDFETISTNFGRPLC